MVPRALQTFFSEIDYLPWSKGRIEVVENPQVETSFPEIQSAINWNKKITGKEDLRVIRLSKEFRPATEPVTGESFGEVFKIENPLHTNDHFWKEIIGLSFSFENEKLQNIREFYQKYGSICPFSRDIGSYVLESWVWVKYNLIWFRYLCNIVHWVKYGTLSPLRELFSTSSEEKSNEEEPKPILSYVFLQYKIYWIPKNDEELLFLAWKAVVDETAHKLQEIQLAPTNIRGQTGFPPIFCQFKAEYALDAAFLQWYFQELASINAKTCAAKGCNNLVLNPRAEYCSKRCREREKKQRQREKKKLNLKPHLNDSVF